MYCSFVYWLLKLQINFSINTVAIVKHNCEQIQYNITGCLGIYSNYNKVWMQHNSSIHFIGIIFYFFFIFKYGILLSGYYTWIKVN